MPTLKINFVNERRMSTSRNCGS